MRVSACYCFLQLLLLAGELDGVSRWELPFSDQKLSKEPKKNFAGVKNHLQRRPPPPANRRDVRRLMASKVSRAALQYGLAWASWQMQHNKFYLSSQEELERYVVWRSNSAYIQYHNSYADNFGFNLAMNSYGDMTSEEYIQTMHCVESPYYHPFSTSPNHRQIVRPLNVTYFDGTRYSKDSLPEEVDWRTKGAVSEVKDQGRCKSCYAFATTAALEGMHALATGKLVSLSEQNIVDCSVPYGNRGCSGGSRMATIMYAVDNGGVDRTSSYPYIGRQYLCKFAEETIGTACTGMVRIRHGNELELKKAVAVVGPVTVAVDSRHTSFQFYASGIYSEPSCSRSKLTHSLIITGYGTKKGHDYWLLKNSWGTSWGEDGYIMMTRNYANQCGIASKAMYTTI